MRDPQRILDKYRRFGVSVTADDSGLIIQGPVTTALMAELREHKDAVERALLAPQTGVMARLWRLVRGG